MGIRLYIHSTAQDLRKIEIGPKAKVSALLREHGGADADSVWLEDQDIPLEEELSLLEAGVGDRAHVHLGRKAKIRVAVFFNGKEIRRRFAPSARMSRVFRWATGRHGFGLSDVDRAEHVLVLQGTVDKPDDDVHIGSLAGPDREFDLELISKERWQG